MATIKVTYGQITREFTVASNATWMELESQLHDLFKIPNETAISVSYIDEDEDVINLSTDSELQKILSDQELFGANVRFNVYTSENPDGNDSNGWNLEDAEENDESVVALKDEETLPNNDEKIVAYRIDEPSETENTRVEQIESPLQHEGQDNLQQQQQQPAVKINYPHVTVTDEDDNPSFEPTIPEEKNSEGQQESSNPVDPTREEVEQKREIPIESSNDPEKQSTTPDENAKENNEESENDPNVFFIFSSSPWIRRTYYRPRVSLLDGLLGENHTHFGHFGHFGQFVRPRYSFVTPIHEFGGHRSRSCGGYYGRRMGGRSYYNYWGYC